MVLCVKCWCDVMCSPPIQVLGLHLTYRTPKRVVFDSMPERGVVYNMLVYREGRYGDLHPRGNVLVIIQRKPTFAHLRYAHTHTSICRVVPFQVRKEPFWRGFSISVQVILLLR